MKAKTNPSTTALYRHLKAHYRVMLAEHDGSLWATNSYWMVRLDGEQGVFGKLLAEYNLPYEPMVCEVGRTLMRTGQDPPNVGALVPDSLNGYGAVERFTIGGAPLSTEKKDTEAELWVRSDDSRLVTLDRRWREFVTTYSAGSAWSHGGDTRRPLVYHDDGKVCALVMPVLHLLTEDTFAPGAKPARKKAAA